jgi:hypothetical protein
LANQSYKMGGSPPNLKPENQSGGPYAGQNKTPAPQKRVLAPGFDRELSSGSGLGQNQSAIPSSITSGERCDTGMNVSTRDGRDPVLDAVRGGVLRGVQPNDPRNTAGDGGDQLRKIDVSDAANVPINRAFHKGQNAKVSERVPGAVADDLSAQGLNPGLNTYSRK